MIEDPLLENKNFLPRYEEEIEEYNKVIKYEKQKQELQIWYEAKSETFKELKEDKQLEKLNRTFKIKDMFLTKMIQKNQKIVEDYVKKRKAEHNMQIGTVSKMQYFMDTLKKLEGETRSPVSHQTLVRTICGDSSYSKYGLDRGGVFDRESANHMIRKMLREASIYESKPGHYNRV